MKKLNNNRLKTGFTIVELLIVIVVIGILAGITIVAYNGISQKAKITTLTSDLVNTSKSLKIYQVTNNTYPVANDCAATPAANTICFKGSANTIYQYSVNNGATPQTFCITASNGTLNYTITQDSAVASGVCSGHVAGGATIITNLALNPALTANNSGWGSAGSVTSPGRAAIADLSGFPWAYRATTTASSDRIYVQDSSATLTAGQVYAASFWAKAPSGATMGYQYSNSAGSGNVIEEIGVSNGSWQRIQFTFTANEPTWRVGYRLMSTAGTGMIYMTGVMLTAGPTNYSYADGSSPGWAWNGTQYNSSSTGPAL